MSQAGSLSGSGGGSGDVQTITGNDSIAVAPASGNINLVTANSTVKFTGSGSTETLDFGIDNLIMGGGGTSITSATSNTGVGNFSLLSLNSGFSNCAYGWATMSALSSGFQNSGFGAGALAQLSVGNDNCAFGQSALAGLQIGSENTAVGFQSAKNLVSGTYNTFLGRFSGDDYTSSESSNILINNEGTTGESNVIRIGTQGASVGQQNRCYVAGQLNVSSGQCYKVTAPGAYPYSALTEDMLIIVDTSSARTITLPAAPVNTPVYVIKDNTGGALVNNITVDGNGKNIDGSATYAISTNRASATICYNGTQWNVI